MRLDRFPLDGNASTYRLRDTFNASRDGGARVHQGIDIHAATGTLVLAPVRGRVLPSPSLTSEHGKTGFGVSLRTSDGHVLHFAHFQGPALVRAGQCVEAGTPLGRVGQSGNAHDTGPHLHFHIIDTDGARVNPFPLLVDVQQRVAPMTDEEFARAVQTTRAWSQTFRLPEWWYSQSDMHRAVARNVRETAQGEVRRATAQATQLRSQGKRDESDAVMHRLVEYAHRVQLVRARLDDREPLTSQVVRELSQAALAVMADTANAVTNVAAGAARAAGAVFGIGLLVAVGIAVAAAKK